MKPPASLEIPPVVLLVFRRPDLTRRVIAALREVRPPRIFIVADGPRPAVPGDAALCAEVRAVCEREIDWNAEIRREFAETNLGLRKRVSSGLDWVFSQVEDAIILEDDCVPQPEFFQFCAELLERYRNDERVGVITGDNFQPQPFDCGASYYFSRFPHCWGWATWRRAWRRFDEPLKRWPALRESEWLDSLFPGQPRAAARWRQIFDETHARKIDSWAYGWVFSCWAAGFLTATPRVNLVENIGVGPEATHTVADHGLTIPKGLRLDFPLVHPSAVTRRETADAFVQSAYFGETNPGDFQIPKSRWRRLLAKVFCR